MLKTLWIMRHGLAVDQFESDFSRALSSIGEKQAEDVAGQLLKDSNKLPNAMLVSPFKRTQSTAKIVHKALNFKQPFQTEDMLVHFGDHKLLGDFLLTSDYEDLIIVSHMPIVAKLCQYLSPGCDIYGFQTAQIVRVDFNGQQTNNQFGSVSCVYLPQN